MAACVGAISIALQSRPHTAWHRGTLLRVLALLYGFIEDLSSNDAQQTVNAIAVPLTLLYYGWALWARRAVESRHHKRFAVPVVFYLIGWVTVWPKFLTEQQFVWPAVVVFIWQFVFWCETAAGVAGGLVLAGKDDAVSAKK